MFGGLKRSAVEMEAKFAAFDKSQGIIEFDLDGRVLTANDNFLRVLGYTLPEVRGQHHSLFIDPAARESAEYRAFWAALREGRCQAGQFRRVGKDNREVWIEASYNPILDRRGRPVK